MAALALTAITAAAPCRPLRRAVCSPGSSPRAPHRTWPGRPTASSPPYRRAPLILRALRIGDPVEVDYFLTAPETPLRVALGAVPLARGGRPLPDLQDTEQAPRTAAGFSENGHRMWLVTVDGRQEASVGATLAQLGRLATDLGPVDAVALDGGGSTTMVRRGVGEPLRVVNAPSADPLRAVTDGLAVLPATSPASPLSSPASTGACRFIADGHPAPTVIRRRREGSTKIEWP